MIKPISFWTVVLLTVFFLSLTAWGGAGWKNSGRPGHPSLLTVNKDLQALKREIISLTNNVNYLQKVAEKVSPDKDRSIIDERLNILEKRVRGLENWVKILELFLAFVTSLLIVFLVYDWRRRR